MLHVHRSERAGPLVDALGALLATPVGDPFDPEVVAVPSRGVERWLAQRLSHVLGAPRGDGVCAGVLFPSHTAVLDDAVAAADPSYARSALAWDPERLVWPLLAVIDRCAPREPWCRSLGVHLGLVDGATDRGRRFAVASSLARHVGAYGTLRPDMLLAWHAGRDEQGDGVALPDDLLWQAELWRRLRAEVGLPSPAELLGPACAALREDSSAVGLPERLSVFGATRLSVSRVQVLAALAEQREVHLWLHHASPALWDAVTGVPGARSSEEPVARHPLLASMSRDVRELELLLKDAVPDLQDSHHADAPRPATLLGRLQEDLAADRVPEVRLPVAPHDRSVQVHACHGPARQVEVVREVVLGLLAADPTLEPRDVLVMCPDVETFAPLVAASFGMVETAGGHPAAQLRVRLADRALRQTNPVLAVLSQLLELAASRVTATQLLDLASTGPVRERFGFDEDDVERLRDWTSAAGVRWGLDAEHRAPFGLGPVAQGTWRCGVDRLLLGVAMQDDVEWVGSALPLDDVDSGDIDLVGRFAELVDRVDHAVRLMSGTHEVTAWADLLEDVLLSLADAPRGAEWQLAQLREELAAVCASADGVSTALGLADLTALLQGRLAGRPSRTSFRTGALTVCTLVPMRSVPHRVVCLLGLDDGAFPRQGQPSGDDVLARAPRTGERDVRSEDRQLFLDAVTAAQEHLVLTCTGADPRTGAAVPPAVPLGELLDALDLTATAPDGGRVRDHVVVHHPLQPFDARNFTAGALGTAGAFSFDPLSLAGARAAAGGRRTAVLPTAEPVRAPEREPVVQLDDLVRFLQHPARGFLRQRLEVTMSAREEDPQDALPVELDGLETWAVGDRVLGRVLAGTPVPTCVALEHLRGTLPPGELGTVALARVGRAVEELVAGCADELVHPSTTVDVQVALPDGRQLVGTVPGVRGTCALSVSYSRLQPKQRLAAWVRHLALVAGRPDTTWTSVTIGRPSSRQGRAELTGPGPEEALRLLARLVALRDTGLQTPLPLPLASGAAWAGARDETRARAAAEKSWADDRFSSEREEPEHVLLWGDEADLPAGLGPAATGLWEQLLHHEALS